MWRQISATSRRSSHSQQPFDCPHYTRLVKHNAMHKLLQQPHGQCGEQKWGDRLQAKGKCTYGANWGSSVTGCRCKRKRDHHLLKSPTIYPQGQVHELHQRGRRPNDDSKWRLPANPTLRQSMGCCGLTEGWNGTSRDQEGDGRGGQEEPILARQGSCVTASRHGLN